METKFIPVTKEQTENNITLWCAICAYCCTDKPCQPCFPDEREDEQQGYYVEATEIMVSVPMSLLNDYLDVHIEEEEEYPKKNKKQ